LDHSRGGGAVVCATGCETEILPQPIYHHAAVVSLTLHADVLDKAVSSTIEVAAGQAFASDAAVRKAIETRAMNLAKEYYAPMFDEVEDTSATESYDLRCTRPDLEVRVEVKGSTGVAEHVFITAGELANAKEGPWRTDLFVVSSIKLNTDATGLAARAGPYELSTIGSPLTWTWLPSSSDTDCRRSEVSDAVAHCAMTAIYQSLRALATVGPDGSLSLAGKLLATIELFVGVYFLIVILAIYVSWAQSKRGRKA